MHPALIVLFVILGIIALLLIVILARTAMFKPAAEEAVTYPDVSVDNDKAVSSLQTLVRFRTESFRDHSLENNEEFDKLTAALPGLYPNVYRECELITLPGRELIYRWKGKSDARASVFMAHYDVVPVNDDAWDMPAFEGIIKDGILWGRGTLDTKVTLNGIMMAADALIAEGFVPEEDIYMAFSGGEEVNGEGAVNAAAYFKENGIELSMVIDEGGGVVKDVFPGVSADCAMVGIGEKGIMDVEYKVKSGGGHASAPKPGSPVVTLSKAVTAVEDSPMPLRLSEPAARMFDTLGRHSSFVYRMIFANMWCFKGVLNSITKKSGGELNALLRTTVAFTKMEGSKATNVIPPEASVVSNIRIAPGDTVESVLAALKAKVNNDKVSIEPIGGYETDPSPVAPVDDPAWDRIRNAVAGTWKGCLVSPYLMVQCSDSRHYRDVTDKVYKFSAMDLSAEERSTIHGNNERIRLEVVGRAVEFFTRLMMQS